MPLPFSKYEISCPAKINLILNVGRVQKNGYHPVETLVQKLNWGDHLRVGLRQSSSVKIKLSCSDKKLEGDDNLIIRAARMFSEEYCIFFEMQAFLKKQIPAQTGLGGGSSDAVSTLKVLTEWSRKKLKQKIPERGLYKIAAALGSDLNLFLESSDHVWCTGRGEKTKPIKSFPKWPTILVFPKTKISTAWAYKEFDKNHKGSKMTKQSPAWVKSITNQDIPILQNDFQSFAMKNNLELAKLFVDLQRSGAMAAQMTGSGSCFYGLFFSEAQAKKAQSFLKKKSWKTQLVLP